MNAFRILTIAAAAAGVVAASAAAARAQDAEWTGWVKSSTDGISYATRCVHISHGRGGLKDFIVPRFRNESGADFTGWWSVSYNNDDPAVTTKIQSSRRKLALQAGVTALAPKFSAVNLCLNAPSIDVGT